MDSTPRKNNENIQALTDKLNNLPINVWLILKLADKYININNLDNAEILYRTASQLNPRIYQPFHGLARVSVKRGDDEKACELCRHALEIDSNSFWSRIILAEALRRLCQFDESAKHFMYAKNMKPGTIEPLRGLIHIFIAKGEYKKAIILLNEEANNFKTIEWSTPKIQVQLNIARANSFYGLYKEARYALDQIPSKILNERQIIETAKILVQIGDIEQARDKLLSLDRSGENCGLVAIEEAEINPRCKLSALKRIMKNNCNYFYSRILLHLIFQGGTKADKFLALLVFFGCWKTYIDIFNAFRFDGVKKNSTNYSGNREGISENIVVSYVCPIHRVDDVNNLVSQLRRQHWRHKEVIIVINGESISKNMIEERINKEDYASVIIEERRATSSIGELLNYGISRASGEYIMRFDADDIYLKNYTNDTITYMLNRKVDVSTKADFYCYFEDISALILVRRSIEMSKEKKVLLATGSTLCAHSSVFKKVLFDPELKTSEDHKFYQECRANGFVITNTPPFNHIVMRKKDGEKHTWNIFNSFLMLPNSIFIASKLDEEQCVS